MIGGVWSIIIGICILGWPMLMAQMFGNYEIYPYGGCCIIALLMILGGLAGLDIMIPVIVLLLIYIFQGPKQNPKI